MIKCSTEAFAICQEKCHHCKTTEQAYFLEGSDCDKFNKEVAATPQTHADRIRAMSDRELAEFLSGKFAEVSCVEHTVSAIQFEAIKQNLYCIFMKWLKQPVKENDYEKDTYTIR